MALQEFSITGIGTPEQVQRVVDAIRTALADEPLSSDEFADAIQQQEEAAAEQDSLNEAGTPPLSLREAQEVCNENYMSYVNNCCDARFRVIAAETVAVNTQFVDEIEMLRASQTATLDILKDLILALQRGGYNVQP